jgi:hypothetical protein
MYGELLNSLNQHVLNKMYADAVAVHREDMDFASKLLMRLFGKKDNWYVDNRKTMLNVMGRAFEHCIDRTLRQPKAIVCSSKVAAVIGDMGGYKCAPASPSMNMTGVTVVGQYMDTAVIVDPFLNWEDSRMLVTPKTEPGKQGTYLFYDSMSFEIKENDDGSVAVHLMFAVKQLGQFEMCAPHVTNIKFEKNFI